MPVSRRTFDRVVADHQRERQQLLAMISDLQDRLMHSVGRTWTPPPVAVVAPPLNGERPVVTVADEQLADY